MGHPDLLIAVNITSTAISLHIGKGNLKMYFNPLRYYQLN